MKQNINLYPFTQVDETPLLSCAHMLKIILMFLTLLLYLTIYQTYRYFSTIKEVEQLKNHNVELDQKVKLLESNLMTPQTREDMIKKISLLEMEHQVKQEVFSTLMKIQSTQSVGFSRYLKALYAQAVPGLWLTNFKFSGDGRYIALEGVAVRAEKVPQFIEGLSKESVFSGKMFQVFKLSVDPKTRHIRFILQTHDKDAVTEVKKQ